MRPDFIVVDFGCGNRAYAQDCVDVRRQLTVLKSKVAKVIGIDIDPGARANPFINKFYLLNSNRWPFKDELINICICDSVIEHLKNPELFLKKPAGSLK